MSYIHNLRRKVGADLLLVPSVAAVIHNTKGELLLQQKRDGSWSLPAGAIEPGETPEQALYREVSEETGLQVKPIALLGVFGGAHFRYTYANGDQVEYTVILFHCQPIGNSSLPTDEETVALQYFPPVHMPPLALPYPQDVLFQQINHK